MNAHHKFDESDLIETDTDPLLGNADAELNSARVSGPNSPEWQALLDRPMTFLLPDDLARDVEQKRWTNATGTLRTWIKGQKVKDGRGPECGLSHHLTRKAKGFFPIVFGKSAGKDRTANAMVTQECMTLDVESGDFYLDAVDRAAKLGIACIAYTSFNDQTEKSHVERDKVLAWMDKAGREGDPTDDDVREWMAASGKYRPEHVASVRIATPYIHTPKGVMIEIAHNPLDKFRMVFPLDKPVEIGRIARKVRDGRDLYKRKLLGLAAKLGLVIDESCIDVSRAFYMPSHPPGAEGVIDIIRGRALTFEELPEGESSKRNAFEKAGAGAETDGREIAGMSAKVWAAKYAKRLRIADLITLNAPERVREDKGSLLVVECPFDEWHSNAGDPVDGGCHVQDADGDTGFVWKCKHNSCSDHDRLDMLHKAIADGWFDESCLVSDAYLEPLSDAERVEEEAAKPKGKRRKAKPATGHDYEEPEPEPEDARFEPRKDWLPSGYKVSGGIVYRLGDEDEGDKPLCQAFDVVGTAANLAGNGDAGVIIHFQNRFGVEVEVTLFLRELTSPTGGGVVEDLADAGMRVVARTKKDRDSLLDLFCRMNPRRHSPTVPRPGWVRDGGGNVLGFMLPSGVYIEAEPANPFRLASVATMKDTGTAGTLEGWQKAANAALAHDRNFYWGWGVCAAFVGPLLSLTDLPACGFNLSGDSSMGKTLSLLLGCAAWGATASKRGTFFKLNSTLNAMEDLASVGSETFMGLDEISMMQNPKALAEMLFALAEGTGKSRKAGRGRGLAEDAEYRPFIGLTNERTLRTVIENAGGDYKTGISVRFPDISVGDGARVSAAEIKVLEDVTRNYGHAGPAFIRWLIANGWHRRGHELRKAVDEAAATLAGDASPAQARAARIFALVQIAGEKACEAGLLDDVAKVRGAVMTAWNAFKASDEGKATEGEASLLDGFRAWLVRAFDVSVMDVSDDTARSYRDLKGWYDEDKIVLIADALNDMKTMGLNGTRAALLRALEDAGALELSGKNRTHNKLPKGIGAGDVPNVRILRNKLGLPHIPKGLGVAL